MNRRLFFKRLLGGIAAAAFGDLMPEAVKPILTEEETLPIFELNSLPLPIVCSDFWLGSSRKLVSVSRWDRMPEVYEEL